MPIALPPLASTTTDFVALGECSLDTLVVVDGFPEPNGKHLVRARVVAPGGQAATAALACRRLGWRTRFVGAVGNDADAHAALEPLVREGVDVRVRVCRGAATRAAIVIVDPRAATRTVLASRDIGLVMAVEPEAIATARVLLVDVTDPAASLAAVRLARQAGVPVVLDADVAGADLQNLLSLVDVIVLPATVVCVLAGTADVGQALARTAAAHSPAAWIATLGAEGAIAVMDGREVRIPPHAVDVVDSTGAGDVFRAGLVAGWLRYGPEARLGDVLRYATVAAGESCRGLGAQGSLPRHEDVASRL